MNNSVFSLQRLWYLIFIEIKFSIKYLSLSLLIPLGIFFLMSFGTYTDSNIVPETGLSMLKSFLVIGGVAMTTYSFVQMYTKSQNYFWYMLPANQLEKFMAKLIFSLVFYSFFMIISFTAIMVVGQLFFGLNEHILLFDLIYLQETYVPTIFIYMKKYMLYNAIFLLGAAFFKKRVFINTLISIAVFFIALSVSIALLSIIAISINFNVDLREFATNLDLDIYFLSILVLWTLAFIFMKRTQVSDGI